MERRQGSPKRRRKPSPKKSSLFFTGKKNKDKEVPEQEAEDDSESFEPETEAEEPTAEDKPAGEEEKKAEEGSQEKAEGEEKPEGEKPEGEKEEAEEKPAEKQRVEVEKVQKVKLRVSVRPGEIRPISLPEKQKALSKMNELIKHETAVREKAEAFNNLEAHIYAKVDFLENEDLAKVSTEADREAFRVALSEGSDWLYAEGFEAETEVLREKLNSLKEIETPMLERYKEMKERPEAIERLRSLISLGQKVVENVTAVAEEDRAQTQEDIDQIKKTLAETQEWLESKVKEQEEKSLLEEPVLKVKDIGTKGASLNSDLQRFFKKPKPKPKKADKPKAKKERKQDAEDEVPKEEKFQEEEAPKEEEQEQQQEQTFQEEAQENQESQEQPKVEHQEL